MTLQPYIVDILWYIDIITLYVISLMFVYIYLSVADSCLLRDVLWGGDHEASVSQESLGRCQAGSSRTKFCSGHGQIVSGLSNLVSDHNFDGQKITKYCSVAVCCSMLCSMLQYAAVLYMMCTFFVYLLDTINSRSQSGRLLPYKAKAWQLKPFGTFWDQETADCFKITTPFLPPETFHAVRVTFPGKAIKKRTLLVTIKQTWEDQELNHWRDMER